MPVASVTTSVGGEAQRQGQRPLLALRRVGAGRQAADGELDARRGAGPTVDTPRRSVVLAGRGQRRGQARARATAAS